MQELLERIYDEVHSAWRFRWIGMAVAVLIAIGGWLFVFSLPDRYEARASVFVDTRTALRPMLQGLTVEQDVNVQLNYVRQSLFAGERLEQIARESGVLSAEETDRRRIAEILDDFAGRVALEVRNAGTGSGGGRQDEGTIYSFRFMDGDRERGLKVIRTVLNTFVEETLGGKREGAQSAQKFLEQEIRDYEARLREAEHRLAEFRKANIGLMPNEQGDYFEQLERETEQAAQIENALGVAVQRREELARQLRGELVVGAAPVTAQGVAGGDTLSARINETQAALDELRLRFTDKHPDVIATAANLEELKARREAEIERLRSGDASAAASSGVSSNPVYQSIQLQLNQADVEIATLRRQLSQRRARAAELHKRMDVAPQVQAEFLQLNRDYDFNRTQYNALLANYERARLGDRADDAGSIRFEIVAPPDSPFGPVSPNRSLLLSAVFFAALGAGGGLAFLLHLFMPVVGSLRGLSELTDLPVIGVVSSAFPDAMAAKARGELLRFVGAAGVLFTLFIGVMALNWAGVRWPGSG
jgi:polysaccharide chain length determinant protein (PEP-CTERM system associated)